MTDRDRDLLDALRDFDAAERRAGIAMRIALYDGRRVRWWFGRNETRTGRIVHRPDPYVVHGAKVRVKSDATGKEYWVSADAIIRATIGVWDGGVTR